MLLRAIGCALVGQSIFSSSQYLLIKFWTAWGLWKIPSCIALRLAYHIDHKVIEISANWSRVSVSISENRHCFARGSVTDINLCARSSSTNTHMHLDIVHCIKECLHESGIPHSPHLEETDMWRWARTSSVGNECFDRRQRNIRTFAGTSVFQSFFHIPSSDCSVEVPGAPSSQASRHCFVSGNILYADFTVKTPLLSNSNTRNHLYCVCTEGYPE